MAKSQLVTEYLENISNEIFEKYSSVITHFFQDRRGIYALYSGQELYYVGLAINLKQRIKHHLRDTHRGKWDRFSAYLTMSKDHPKEMESLLLRIFQPQGNSVKGKFSNARDLRKEIQRAIRGHQEIERERLFGTKVRHSEKIEEKELDTKVPVLANYPHTLGKTLKTTYKGKAYKAHVLSNGKIRLGSRTFNSPSKAAMSFVSHARNGWLVWKIERAPGDWIPLNKMRRAK